MTHGNSNWDPSILSELSSLAEGSSPSHVRWPLMVDLLRRSNATPLDYRQWWDRCWADWSPSDGPRIQWTPDLRSPDQCNVSRWMSELHHGSYQAFHQWTVTHRDQFWQQAAARLQIQFDVSPSSTVDLSGGVERAVWFPGAKLNIVDSCFSAEDDAIALVAQKPGGSIRHTTYASLRARVDEIAHSIVSAGYRPGDAIAVVLPMTELSVAIYLGIVKAGCVVVSIADSFAPPEIENRLRIANAKTVFTYDVQCRNGKSHPLYNRVCNSTRLPIVVIPDDGELQCDIRDGDIPWDEFLIRAGSFESVIRDGQDPINILFSSGTTGDPKAIPWNQLTPIRCAIDGHCHQNIKADSVCAWPTNLGWMMGPWLIFASLINRATIAIYEDAPLGTAFGQFVEDAKITMLGVVPTLVKTWKSSGCMESLDWSSLETFSSTGESSQVDDMFYLSSLAGIRPIIEYCGGTEVGGGYVSSVTCLPNAPSCFNTATVGLEFVLLDEDQQTADEGEVFLIPPSIGLSAHLLNRDHDATYYEGTPKVDGLSTLRRHGDHFRRLKTNAQGFPELHFFMAGGRVDDTMNLGGIKVSSAEIERILNQLAGVCETAAVAVAADGGPAQLEVFAVVDPPVATDPDAVLPAMNASIKSQLNPLFKIHAVHVIDQMPRTASGKIMRRELRRPSPSP